MASKNNKKKKTVDVKPVTLIPRPENTKYGYYVNIAKTDWRYASKVIVPSNVVPDITSAISFTTLYFPKVIEAFTFEGGSAFANRVKFTGRYQGPHLFISAVLERDDNNYTLNFCFKDGLLTPGQIDSYFLEKTSTFYQELRTAAKEAIKYSPKKKAEIRTEYLSQGMPPIFAQTLAGDMGISTERILKEFCATLLLYYFLDLFKLFSTYDYSLQLKNYSLEFTKSVFCVTRDDLTMVEARCSAVTTPVSDIAFDCMGENRYTGDVLSFFNIHGEAVGASGAFKLTALAHSEEGTIDLDAVTRNAKSNFFYVDEAGRPMKSVEFYDAAKAVYQCCATGIASRVVTKPELYGIYGYKNGRWEFLYFAVLSAFVNDLLTKGILTDVTEWSSLVDPSRRQEGAGLKEDVPEVSTPGYNAVTNYACAQELFDMVSPASNIENVEDANWFIGSYIRLLRRRDVEWGFDYAYNTGLLSKEGNQIWLFPRNFKGPLDKVYPTIVKGMPNIGDAVSPVKDKRFLLYNAEKPITVDLRSIQHTLQERDYRLPASVKDLQFERVLHYITRSVEKANEMVKVNPLWAQPMWSERDDMIHYLIPLYGDTFAPSDLLAALFVRNSRVATIYSIELARKHSVFIPIPRAQWLATVVTSAHVKE